MKPGLERLTCELGPVIAADVLWLAVAQDETVENFQNVAGGHSGGDLHGQGLAGVLVEDCQHLVAAAIAQLVVHEVDAPDVIGMRRPKPDDRAVVVVEPSALRVAVGLLQPFFAPQALDLLVVHTPAFDPQQLGNLAVAIAAIRMHLSS